MDSWDDVRRWRRAQRAGLLAERDALTLERRRALAARIAERLAARAEFAGPAGCVGFYWPIRSEPDLRPFVRGLLEQGFDAALPVVVEKNAPLEFRRWHARTRMTRQAVWGIPVPAERDVVVPDVLIVPLVGADAKCYRLGYGAGYYDRTLAFMERRPTAIGVGFDFCMLATIHPQPHDVPMDAVATDARTIERAGQDAGGTTAEGDAVQVTGEGQ